MEPADRLAEAGMLLGLLLLAVIALLVVVMVLVYIRHQRKHQERTRSKLPSYTLEELQQMLAEGHISTREYERLRRQLYGRAESSGRP